jgi:hypothetical protein
MEAEEHTGSTLTFSCGLAINRNSFQKEGDKSNIHNKKYDCVIVTSL